MKTPVFAFCFFILSLSFGLAQEIQSVPQKPTDTPRDQVIRIKTHDGGTYCYSPHFTKGYGYVLLSDCAYATPARYDVFQRISWKVNGIWMCLSAPSSVTGIDGKSTQQWDWLLIEPCSLNDANQRWVVRDSAFYTADGRFKIKDSNWYAFISKNAGDYYDHSLDMGAMKTWLDTIATPGSIAIRTFVGWSFIAYAPPQFAIYYLQNNESYRDDIKQLFYNPDNGHIAQFDYVNGRLYCMTSRQGKGDEWNWISWESCTDEVPQAKDSQYWEFFALNNNEGALRDWNGNFLRITQYGPHWGVPYTAKPEYLEKDTDNAAKSLFVFDKYVDSWNRYVNANLGDSLAFCPAPGRQSEQNLLTLGDDVQKEESGDSKRGVRSLPPSFQISEDWIRRFWQIGTTAQRGGRPLISYCGTCLLHSYQVIAELHENYLRGPLNSGGYFFDTMMGSNPFDSFRQRFPILAQRLEGTLNLADAPLRAGETDLTRTVRTRYAMALTMLSNYHITPSRLETSPREMRALVESMFASPVGTTWIVNFTMNISGGRQAHGQPVLRTEEGLLFIPTNTPSLATYESYRAHFFNSIFRDATSAIAYMTPPQGSLVGLMYLRIDNYEANPINVYLSNNNCTGLGQDRRGSLLAPISATINQCRSGRCAIQ